MSTENPESQKPAPQPALAAVGEVGGRIPTACLGTIPGAEGDHGAAIPNPIPGRASEARGVELLVQWQNLLHEAALGLDVDDKLRAFKALDAWEQQRTEAEWELMRIAQFGAGKVGLRKLVEQYEGVSPIGQRR